MLLALAAVLANAAASPPDRSYQLFLDAEKAYGEGRAEEAVKLLEEAYRLKPEPVLLYNLARAHETLGHLEQALDCYRRYLAADPKAAGRGAITARITALEQQLKEREELELERQRAEADARAAKAAKAAAERRPFPSWVVPLAAGGLGLVAGAVLKGVAISERGTADADPVHETALARFNTARTLDTAAIVALVAGGALAAAGLVWTLIAIASPGGAQNASVELALGPGLALLAVRF